MRIHMACIVALLLTVPTVALAATPERTCIPSVGWDHWCADGEADAESGSAAARIDHAGGCGFAGCTRETTANLTLSTSGNATLWITASTLRGPSALVWANTSVGASAWIFLP